MEDGEAIELIQRAIERGEAGESFVEFGGLKPPRPRGNIGEANIRGFWMHYARLMDGNDG